jgi:hypothetical protein
MLVHRLLDAIAKKPTAKDSWIILDGVTKNLVDTLVEGIHEAIASDSLFDFGTLVLEKIDMATTKERLERSSNELFDIRDAWTPDEWKQYAKFDTLEEVHKPENQELLDRLSRKLYKLPDLSMEEKKFWFDGLIPLPAPICWYEYVIGGKWHGVMVVEDPDTRLWTVTEVELNRDNDGTFFAFDGVRCSLDRHQCVAFSPDWAFATHGNNKLKNKHRGYSAGILLLSVYLTMMLYSKSTEQELVPAPIRLNKGRIAKGLTPLPAHRVVRIVPQRFLQTSQREGQTERRPARLHWRRPHLRHFEERPVSSTRAVYKAEEFYKGRTGWWVTLIPRMLVNYASPEAVSHEYKIG